MEIKYTFNPENIPSKLNPQQKQLVVALKDMGTVTKEEILEVLNTEGTLTTRQDPWLIFKYYQPGFIKEGFVELNKTMKPKVERIGKKDVETVIIERDESGFPLDESKEELEKQGF